MARASAHRPILDTNVWHVALAVAVFVVTAPCAARAQPHHVGREFLPPEHWAYAALYRFEALGLVSLPSRKPYSRDDVAAYLATIESELAAAPRSLSARERFNLTRLQQEFAEPASLTDPKRRYDPALVFIAEPPLYFEADVDLSLVPQQTLDDKRWEFLLIGNPSARLHLADWATYDVRYRLTMGPERGDRVRDAKPSPRERSFKGLTSLYERAYIVTRWKPITFLFGREYSDWGPAEDGNLHLSETAQSLDQFGARIVFRNVEFSFVHPKLSAKLDRYLSAHRLEIRFRRATLGLVESVVYAGRGLDPTYLLPLSSFYANQFNERENDNVIWSIDLKAQALDGLLLYGSFLIDDFQFERDGGYPDKIAFDLGARAALGAPVPATVRLRYRYVDIYTYTHEDSLNAHVAGSGDPAAGEPLLGAAQGPDSDLLTASVAVFPLKDVRAAVSFALLRRGEGNDFRGFVPGADPSPPFPLGVVEKTYSYGVSLDWELPRNSLVSLELQRALVENIDHRPGADEWRNAARLVSTWDF